MELYKPVEQARMEWRTQCKLEDGSLPRTVDAGHGVELAIGLDEDSAALELLDGLGEMGETYMYERHSTLIDLLGFVRNLNATRPPGLHLDVVVVNDDMYDVLFGNLHGKSLPSWGHVFCGGRKIRPNVTVLGRVTFLHHSGIPHDCAYALSSMQAPVFVCGPWCTACADGELVNIRQSGFANPPHGVLDPPWGVKIDVRGF